MRFIVNCVLKLKTLIFKNQESSSTPQNVTSTKSECDELHTGSVCGWDIALNFICCTGVYATCGDMHLDDIL